MPKVNQDGTKMWCPKCQKVSICKAVDLASLGKPAKQRKVVKSLVKNIQVFSRGRVCKTCNGSFVTAEVNEDLIEELAKLRFQNYSLLYNLKALFGKYEGFQKHLEQIDEERERILESMNTINAALMVIDRTDMYQYFDDLNARPKADER